MDEQRLLFAISATQPLDRRRLADFDDALEGPSFGRIVDRRYEGGRLGIAGHGVGRYALRDSDVFRPLQYCAVYLMEIDEKAEWLARLVVAMSGAHLEGLVKRIVGLHWVPLGRGVREAIVNRKVDVRTGQQLRRFSEICNTAKHEFERNRMHLFSIGDAVVAYAVSRRLAQRLYPLANLATDWRNPRGDQETLLDALRDTDDLL